MQRRDMPVTKSSAGFTLIELLVVIAIIAILASILFPVFAQAREKARQSSCLSNQKQLALGVLTYVQDYDEGFPLSQFRVTPPVGNASPSGDTAYEWTWAVQPYIKNGTVMNQIHTGIGSTGPGYRGGVFSCPSSADPDQGNIYKVRDDLFMGTYCYPGQTTWAGPCQLGTLAVVDKPANKIMILESGTLGIGKTATNPYDWNHPWWFVDHWYGIGMGKTPGYGGSFLELDGTHGDCDLPNSFAGDPGWQTCNGFPRYRHNKTSNFAFLDGHVKSIPRGGLDFGKHVYLGRMDESARPPSWFYNQPY